MLIKNLKIYEFKLVFYIIEVGLFLASFILWCIIVIPKRRLSLEYSTYEVASSKE